ncbi:hypothetical protein [Streptomyces sp. NPDC049879]|uniref:hypothetical protein n=1 Tax=Streptomyces sp. NPDC049879 TaxID=3365598 RepID=UPI0037BC5002
MPNDARAAPRSKEFIIPSQAPSAVLRQHSAPPEANAVLPQYCPVLRGITAGQSA